MVGRPKPEAEPPDYHDLLERVPAILYIADPGVDGRWQYVSPQIEAILGFSPAEWCSDPKMWANRLHPADRDRVIAEESRQDSDLRRPSAAEYRMIHRRGHTVWLRDDALLVHDRHGQTRWHGVLSDITVQKLAEAELEQRAAQQAAVARLGEHALEGATIFELMNEALTGAAEFLDAEFAAVAEYTDGGSFVHRAGIGFRDDMVGRVLSTADAQSQAAYCMVTGGPVKVVDWATERRFGRSPLLAEIGARSGLCVPIEGRSGPFGILGIQSLRPRDYTTGDIDFLHSLANVLADALERRATEDDIRHRALHDPLTTLPNRVLFLDRLGQALARQQRRGLMTAILFLDLDRFKLINDSLGHQLGDELLTAVASRIRAVVRDSDTVARFGGDEFAVLLEDVASEYQATQMAERIAALFTRPFVLAGNDHFITTSIGIAFASGGELPDELVRDADAAMYRAKERGPGRYELFDEVMRGTAIARLRVENDLRRALERDELRVEYQPIVSLRERLIVGVEALVRWHHPERGVVPPSDFIPLAEDNGLIEPIGRWVLETACRQGAKWHEMRPDQAPIGIAVNLSAVQIAGRGLAQTVATVLRSTGLDPSSLSLEITESVMLRDADALQEVLPALKATGVRLVLDDFGTGYSSLGYLTHLPIDAIKVDRSFVDGLGTEARGTAITEAIVAMSRALSLDVVGEGVETPLQAAELIRLGCDLAQGFHFSRPVEAGRITAMLREGLDAEWAQPPTAQG
jgi:diguanylate cyclase (GGDEF)-like protein/PAS domain S-box-containing protein